MVRTDHFELLKKIVSEHPDTETLLLEITGEKGQGKSYCISQVLKELNYNYKEIDLSINKEIPFGALIYNLHITPDEVSFKEAFFTKIQEVIKSGQTIFFTNFEVCDPDSHILIKYLFNYYILHQIPALLLVETNSSTCHFSETEKIKTILFDKLRHEQLEEFGWKIVKANNDVLQKIIKLSDGNIGRFQIVCRILSHLHKIENSSFFNFMTLKAEDIPNSLVSACIKHYELIEDHLKPVLKIISFIDDHFYEELLQEAYESIYIDHIQELVKLKTIISHTDLDNTHIQGRFRKKYRFILSEFKNQIVHLSRSEKYELLKPYLLHLKDLADNPRRFGDYSYLEQIIILQSILNNYKVTDNILEYGIKLMKNYYTHFAYENVLTLRKKLLSLYNDQQINSLHPDYLEIVLTSFILTNRYKEAIEMEKKTSSAIEDCLVAKGFYLNGEPMKALQIVDKIAPGKNDFEVFNLKASIYNWFSNMRECVHFIKKAQQVATKEQKYQILKKVEMDIDIDPEEPKNKQQIDQAVIYFRGRSKRELAEILFNLGTSYLFKASPEKREEGVAKIKEAKNLLEEICDSEVWYCNNSLAISYALAFDFQKAIQLWESIIEPSKTVCFCELAIYLNIACASVKINNPSKAEHYLKIAEKKILEYANRIEENKYKDLHIEFKKIATEHADINLCIRNYFLIYALYIQAFQKNKEGVVKYANMASASSDYPSASEYLLFDLSSRTIKSVGTNYIKRFFADHQMYFCSIMFWE